MCIRDSGWAEGFAALIDRIASRFARYEPVRHAAALIAGLVSGVERKNCWTIAEHRGHSSPDALQHLLSRAKWDAEEVRDDLRGYVVDNLGCLLYTSPSPRDRTRSRMPSSA